MLPLIGAVAEGALAFVGWSAMSSLFSGSSERVPPQTPSSSQSAQNIQNKFNDDVANRNNALYDYARKYTNGSSAIPSGSSRARNTALAALAAGGVGAVASGVLSDKGANKDGRPVPMGSPFVFDDLLASLNQVAENGQNIYYALDGEQGLNDRFVEIQNVLVDVRESVDLLTSGLVTGLNDINQNISYSSAELQKLFNSGSSVVSQLQNMATGINASTGQLGNIASKSFSPVVNVSPAQSAVNVNLPVPEVTVNNSINFDSIKTPLEEIARSQKAYLEPSNVQINGQTVQASAAGLASMANISHIETNTLKKEALSYEAAPKSLTLVSGEPAVEISPREAKALSAAQNMKHKSDINNEKFEDDDFDFRSLVMPMLSFKGVGSELDAINGLFSTGLSTNPFNLNFDLFGSYTDSKETV